MVKYIYSHSKEEAAELRKRIIQNFVIPVFRKAFERYPQLNSAMLLVAQYWDDEAIDAVHHVLFFSVLETLKIKALFEAELHPQGLDPVNLPGLPRQYSIQQSIEKEIHDEARIAERSYTWESNGETIPAFAAFCKEDCHQDMMVSEAYSPYAILHRKRENIEVKVIGKMRRPWLDGIKPYEYIYSGQEAANLREEIVENYVNLVVKMAFDKYPQLNSAMLLVAQYWDDEADDAVHEILFFSVLGTIDIETVWKNECKADPVNLPGLPRQLEILFSVREEFYKEESLWQEHYWDDNGKAIPAFAAFCKEGCHQLMSFSEAYTPYAILRRKGEEIEVEVIGKMLRPWLDGIKPEEWSE